MKSNVLVLAAMSLLLFSVSVMGACVVPTENMTVTSTENNTLCTGSYNLNDSDGNGAIMITGSNLIFDCNSSLLNGNKTTNGIAINISQGLHNITIKNCNINNYFSGIKNPYYGRSENYSILNNKISNVTIGINLQDIWYSNIFNNTILDNTSITSGYPQTAIAIRGTANNNAVENNTITSYVYGVRLTTSVLGTNIKLNNFYLSEPLDTGVFISDELSCNNTYIGFNNLNYSARNSIQIEAKNVLVENNTFFGYRHHAIDVSSAFTTNKSNNVTIRYNDISNMDYVTFSTVAISVTSSKNILIHNNNIHDIPSTYNAATVIGGLSLDGVVGENISIYNNTFDSISGYSLEVINQNPIIQDNIFSNYDSIIRLAYNQKNTTFRNNIYSKSYSNFTLWNVTLNLNETSNEHDFYFLNAGIARFIYSGRKDLTITNNSIKVEKGPTKYSVFNITSGKTVYTSIDTFTLEVGANQEYEIRTGCVYPSENMTVTSTENNTLCGGENYQFNDSEGYGAIKIKSNNVVLDCNNSALIGNYSVNSKGINSEGYSNVTIKNCIVNKYYTGIRIANGQNNTIINNIGYNASNQIFLCSYSTKNCRIINNTAYQYYSGGNKIAISLALGINNSIIGNYIESVYNGISVTTNTNATISFNTINKTYKGMDISSSNNTYVYNNYLTSNATVTSWSPIVPVASQYSVAITGIDIKNYYVYQNTINNHLKGLELVRINNTELNNNDITDVDMGIYIRNSSDGNIYSNDITRASSFADYYGTAIILYGNNVTQYNYNWSIYDNNFVDYGHSGIELTKSRFIRIYSNYFSEIPLTSKDYEGTRCGAIGVNGGCDRGESPTAIRIVQVLAGWSSNADENNNGQNLSMYFANMRSNNITIYDNTFSSNTQTYFWNQGGSDVSVSLPEYWYNKVWMMKQGNDWLTDVDEMYMNPSINTILNYDSYQSSIASIRSDLRKFYTGESPRWNMTYWMSKQFRRYDNDMASTSMISLYNLSTSNTLINSSGTYQDITATELNQTIGAGKCVDVIYYTSATDPKMTEALGPCGLTAFSYDSSTKLLSLSSTNGTYNLTGMQVMAGSDDVNVYHDGAFVERLQADGYTISSSGLWEFYPADIVSESAASSCATIKSSILTVIGYLGLLVLIVIAGAVVLGVMGKLQIDWAEIELTRVIIGVTIIGFVVVIGMLILSAMC